VGRLSRLRVRPGDIEATNTPADTQVPSYDLPSNLFKWVTAAGGNWSLVEEITLAVNASYLDFLNLDINTCRTYLLTMNARTLDDSYLYLFAETDYTPGNYRTQQLVGSGSSALAARVSFPIIGFASAAEGTIGCAYIFRDMSSRMRAVGWCNVYQPDYCEIWENAIVSVSTFTNITRLRIQGAMALILAGSRFALFRAI